MIIPFAYQGKRIGVFGLARTGVAAVEALLAAGAKVYAWDDDAIKRSAVENPVDLYALDMSQLDALMLAPGVPLTHPAPHPLVVRARAAGVPVIGDFDLFQAARADLPPHKLVVVTGTNGKSTSVALIKHIIETAGIPVAMGGNIGTGVMALEPLSDGGVYVIEASSFQLDLAESFSADVAVLLNITPDHLDRHGDMHGYAAAKSRLFQMQHEGAKAFIGVDDEWSREIADKYPHAVAVSVNEMLPDGICVVDGILFDNPNKMVAGVLTELPTLVGEHNYQNAAAAYGVCQALGIEHAQIITGLQTFPGLAHRQELVKVDGDVRFINDSKATNLDAAATALKSYRNIRWLAGGRSKGSSLAPILPLMPHVKHAYLFGEAADMFAEGLKGSAELSLYETLEDAVQQAASDAEPGDVVLLSPACSSFDAYRDFEVRGEAFKRAVKECMGTVS